MTTAIWTAATAKATAQAYIDKVRKDKLDHCLSVAADMIRDAAERGELYVDIDEGIFSSILNPDYEVISNHLNELGYSVKFMETDTNPKVPFTRISWEYV